MGVNKKLIERYKYMYNETKHLTTAIYAAIAYAMDEMEYPADEIERIFAKSQQIWIDHQGRVSDMADEVERRTGIDVREGK